MTDAPVGPIRSEDLTNLGWEILRGPDTILLAAKASDLIRLVNGTTASPDEKLDYAWEAYAHMTDQRVQFLMELWGIAIQRRHSEPLYNEWLTKHLPT